MGRETKVEELELSVRTTHLLLKLGVETVGDLLDRPAIEAPPLVVAELSETFEELGVEYRGEWKSPAMPALLSATGTVAERWTTIAEWLKAHHPAVLETFRPAASPEIVANAEEALGVKLPEEYKQFLSLHDGQEDSGPMVASCSLLPTAEVVEQQRSLGSLFQEGAEGFDSSDVAEGIAPLCWNEGWVPIGQFQRDSLILDLAPAEGGTHGQIFLAFVDDDRRELVATSFAELLSRFFHELQDGTIDLDDDDDDDDD